MSKMTAYTLGVCIAVGSIYLTMVSRDMYGAMIGILGLFIGGMIVYLTA